MCTSEKAGCTCTVTDVIHRSGIPGSSPHSRARLQLQIRNVTEDEFITRPTGYCLLAFQGKSQCITQRSPWSCDKHLNNSYGSKLWRPNSQCIQHLCAFLRCTDAIHHFKLPCCFKNASIWKNLIRARLVSIVTSEGYDTCIWGSTLDRCTGRFSTASRPALKATQPCPMRNSVQCRG
jgi:hypothetical protein